MFSGLCEIGGPAPPCVGGGDGSEITGGPQFDFHLIPPTFWFRLSPEMRNS